MLKANTQNKKKKSQGDSAHSAIYAFKRYKEFTLLK